MLVLCLLAVDVWAVSKDTSVGVVNINTASKAELMLLPGIGDTKADAIMAVRQKTPFTRLEDLLAVKGIGDKLVEKMAPYIVTSGTTTLKQEIKRTSSPTPQP